MVEITCMLIKRKRKGSFKQHLHSVLEMLPYLAGSGYYLYAKFEHIFRLCKTLKTQSKNHMKDFNKTTT